MTDHIDPSILAFLADIADNNNKAWFDANRTRYQAVRNAFLELVEVMVAHTQSVDSNIGVQDVAKCLYRINRDTRFSPDKSPYKRHFGAFVAPGGRTSPLPGYYLHIQPNNESFFCSGNYSLDAYLLKRLRTEVSNFPEELDAILHDPAFRNRLTLAEDEKLKSAPRGFSIDPRYADYLKYKTLNAMVRYTDDEVTAPGFVNRLCDDISLAQPLNAFFYRALTTEPDEECNL